MLKCVGRASTCYTMSRVSNPLKLVFRVYCGEQSLQGPRGSCQRVYNIDKETICTRKPG